MLKKILSLLILLFFVFSLTFSAYPGSGDDEPETKGHPWDDVTLITPLPEDEGSCLIISWNFNWMPYFTVLVYKTNSCSLGQVQERTKKEIRKGEAKSFQKPNSEKER